MGKSKSNSKNLIFFMLWKISIISRLEIGKGRHMYGKLKIFVRIFSKVYKSCLIWSFCQPNIAKSSNSW